MLSAWILFRSRNWCFRAEVGVIRDEPTTKVWPGDENPLKKASCLKNWQLVNHYSRNGRIKNDIEKEEENPKD